MKMKEKKLKRKKENNNKKWSQHKKRDNQLLGRGLWACGRGGGMWVTRFPTGRNEDCRSVQAGLAGNLVGVRSAVAVAAALRQVPRSSSVPSPATSQVCAPLLIILPAVRNRADEPQLRLFVPGSDLI